MSDDIDDLKQKLKANEEKIKDQSGGHRNLLWILLIVALLGAAYYFGYGPVVERYARQAGDTFKDTFNQVKTSVEETKEILEQNK